MSRNTANMWDLYDMRDNLLLWDNQADLNKGKSFIHSFHQETLG